MKQISYVLCFFCVIAAYKTHRQAEPKRSDFKEINLLSNNPKKTINSNPRLTLLPNKEIISDSESPILSENERPDFQSNEHTTKEEPSQDIGLQENDEQVYDYCDRIDPDNTSDCVMAQQKLKEATIQALKERIHFDQKYLQEYYQNND